jgi:hypothetical protein
VAEVVPVKLVQELLDKMRPLRLRSHDAHVALEHVDELGQFVEIGTAQENADAGAARIVGGGPMSIPFLLASYAANSQGSMKGHHRQART